MNKYWIDNADSYLCPECGFEVNNPAKVNLTCPRCGFIERRGSDMAKLSDIEIKMQLRPCLTNFGKGLFHRWIDGQFFDVFGLVELDDGKVVEVTPNNIQFIDNLCEGFAWPDTQDSK